MLCGSWPSLGGVCAMADRVALRRNVVSSLTSILGGDQTARRAAEEELKTLEVTEEFGLVLAEITVSTDSPVEYRQLSSIILKQYVETHWNNLSEKFQEPEPPEQVKMGVRKLLPSGLADTHSKVRSTVAYAISAIAHWDWPENWPDLFDLLMLALASSNPDLVHGSMRVLSEFCQDVSDTQMPQVAPVILPQLLKVIVQPDMYSVRTRSRAVHIFNVISVFIYGMSYTFPEAAKSLLLPILLDYITAFVEVLSSQLPSNSDDLLRKEVIMTLCQLLRSFPRPLTPHIMDIVTPVWNILVSSTPLYVSQVVNSSESVREGACDSDGEVIGQESTIFAVFEFISVLGEARKFQNLLPPILPELMYYLIAHMQITEEQASDWLEDINQFVEEDENEFSYSIRLSAYDLIQSLCEESSLQSHCHSAIISAMDKHFQEATRHNSLYWWKVHEASMMALSIVVEEIKFGRAQLDCQTFTDTILLPDLSAHNAPCFLMGRCLWLAGKMATHLKPSTLSQSLELVATALQPSRLPVLRVLAAKAAFLFCEELKSTGHAQLLTPYLPHYIEHLSAMTGDFPEEVICLVVDALQLVIQINPQITTTFAGHVIPAAMSLFLKYSHDPGISSAVEEVFAALAANPGCHGDLHMRYLPVAVEALQSNETQVPLGLVGSVLDVLVHIVRGCGGEGRQELRASIVSQVFPSVVQRILSSDDSAILQNGGECVRAFVSTAVEQLAEWRDSSGRDGLQYVIQVVLHLLDPARPEYSASFVGKFIIAFVKVAGNVLGENLELLLRAVLSKMHSVQTSSVMQSLLIVFAHLIQTELESVVSFLSKVPDPEGKPALNFVMKEWCARHPFFFGVYETRVSSLALCSVLTHCIATGDERLTNITVRAEDTSHSAQQFGIQTRSQRAASSSSRQQWTDVFLPVKIVKLLVSDLQSILESEAQPEDEDGRSSNSSEGESLETTLESLLAPARDYPGYDVPGGGAMAEWEVEDDPDLTNEPLLSLDMHSHLVGYMLELSRQPCFTSTFLPQLSSYELCTLSKVGIVTN